jgi:limonene 1,2-monooxygenase
MVANRLVLLDHLTRGRVMLGVGPGALTTDAYMLGIDPTRQRDMMDESLGLIRRLLTETAPITYKSDWFELHEALLHLRPYTQPHFPIAVASVQSPAGVELAGKHGAGILSMSVYTGVRGVVMLPEQWKIAEETAALHGQTMDRREWRLVVPMHLAESRREALDDARLGAGLWLREYFDKTLGHPVPTDVPDDQLIEKMAAEGGAWVVGTPDDAMACIEHLAQVSGGFGGLLLLAHEWAPRDKILRSYELLARYVMPRYQGALTGTMGSNAWARSVREELYAKRQQAIDKAHTSFDARRRARQKRSATTEVESSTGAHNRRSGEA